MNETAPSRSLRTAGPGQSDVHPVCRDPRRHTSPSGSASPGAGTTSRAFQDDPHIVDRHRTIMAFLYAFAEHMERLGTDTDRGQEALSLSSLKAAASASIDSQQRHPVSPCQDKTSIIRTQERQKSGHGVTLNPHHYPGTGATFPPLFGTHYNPLTLCPKTGQLMEQPQPWR